jgi:dihydrofolate reductase
LSRTQYYCAATLGGFIAGPGGDLEWLFAVEGGKESYEPFFAEVGALAMGSGTYEWLQDRVDNWPYPDHTTWVFSHRELKPFDEAELRFVQGPPREHIDDMRAAAGERNVWVVGGGDLASQFADEGLLDELILTVAPVVLAEGIPLFARGIPGQLRLADTRRRGTAVELRYELPSAETG